MINSINPHIFVGFLEPSKFMQKLVIFYFLSLNTNINELLAITDYRKQNALRTLNSIPCLLIQVY